MNWNFDWVGHVCRKLIEHEKWNDVTHIKMNSGACRLLSFVASRSVIGEPRLVSEPPTLLGKPIVIDQMIPYGIICASDANDEVYHIDGIGVGDFNRLCLVCGCAYNAADWGGWDYDEHERPGHLRHPHPKTCHECFHWEESFQLNKIVIRDGSVYHIGRSDASELNRGYAGALFHIIWNDDTDEYTNNLWHLGKMNEFWRKTHPDNCKELRRIT